jgi:hypothetical protein
MRYFVEEFLNGALYGLYRFEAGESGLVEQHWTGKGWIRDDDAKVVTYLALGEGDLEEITRENAHELHPAAFDSAHAQTVLPGTAPSAMHESANTRPDYIVVYIGSSIVGVSRSYEAYKAAKSFLQAKSDAGKAKCFHWWCEPCKDAPLQTGDEVDSHYIEVSIPNVLKISDGQEVKWGWEDPKSEWARSRRRTAADEFSSIVERKSRPNWKIYIRSFVS